MDGIKLSVTKLEPFLAHTDNHVWYGILKREFKTKKNTLSEWLTLIEQIKIRAAK